MQKRNKQLCLYLDRGDHRSNHFFAKLHDNGECTIFSHRQQKRKKHDVHDISFTLCG